MPKWFWVLPVYSFIPCFHKQFSSAIAFTRFDSFQEPLHHSNALRPGPQICSLWQRRMSWCNPGKGFITFPSMVNLSQGTRAVSHISWPTLPKRHNLLICMQLPEQSAPKAWSFSCPAPQDKKKTRRHSWPLRNAEIIQKTQFRPSSGMWFSIWFYSISTIS